MFEAVKKYAVFSGRSRRKEYWLFMLFYMILNAVAMLIDGAMGIVILQLIVGLGLLIPSIAVSVRRLHDRDKSGWWILLGIIPLIGIIIIFVWFCGRGTVGENRFGDDPLADE